MAGTPSIEELWDRLWEKYRDVYVFAIPEYTEVLAFTDDIKLYYDGADPLFCDVCNGYTEGSGPYTVNGVMCPHVIKGTGATLALALESALSVR